MARLALSTNQGRALLAAGRVQEAIAALTNAVRTPLTQLLIRLWLALGSAYEKIGDIRNAGCLTQKRCS